MRQLTLPFLVAALIGGAAQGDTIRCTLKDKSGSGFIPAELMFEVEDGSTRALASSGFANHAARVLVRDSVKMELRWQAPAMAGPGMPSARDRAERPRSQAQFHATFLRNDSRVMLKVRPADSGRSFTGLGVCHKDR